MGRADLTLVPKAAVRVEGKRHVQLEDHHWIENGYFREMIAFL
jgi:hypothetical protein